MTEFQQRLRKLMDYNQLDDIALAKNTDIEISLIYNYLRGTYLPSLENAILLANANKTTLDYLFGFSEIIDYDCPRECKPFHLRFREVLVQNQCTRYRLRVKGKFSKKSVDDWFFGRTTPNIGSLIRLAQYFNMSLDELIGR